MTDDLRMTGACFDRMEGIGGALLLCHLGAGHSGAHESPDGARWSYGRIPDRSEQLAALADELLRVAHALTDYVRDVTPATLSSPDHTTPHTETAPPAAQGRETPATHRPPGEETDTQ